MAPFGVQNSKTVGHDNGLDGRSRGGRWVRGGHVDGNKGTTAQRHPLRAYSMDDLVMCPILTLREDWIRKADPEIRDGYV